MDDNLISYESMLAAREAAEAAYWTMILTAAGVVASLFTLAFAIYAAKTARHEISSWREQQKLLQLVRLKRAVFCYRQKLEENIFRAVDVDKFNEILREELQPLLAGIYHEFVLSGLDGKEGEQAQLFRQLMDSHNLQMKGTANWPDVYDKAAKLQQSIKVKL